jgi:7-carboxy-7-deazaguanine synthase
MNKSEFIKSKIPIVEIFNSISGEGISAGEIFTFVRVAGCNLRCNYCDTKYSYDENSPNIEMLTPDEILLKVMEIGCKNILCTGGEPLELLKAKRYLPLFLSSKGLKVRIESNGSCPVYNENEINEYIDNSDRYSINYVLDVKCPSSGNKDMNYNEGNFQSLKLGDELKFVVGKHEDIEYSFNVIEKHKTLLANKRVVINFSPIFDMCSPKDLVEILKEKKIYFENNNLISRLSLQIHKYIWPVDKRGV